MAFRVELTRRAERDIEEAFEYIHSRATLNAIRWREGLKRRLGTLKTTPEAFGFAPENAAVKADVRQLLFGSYRVLYTVRETTVNILTVRHGARRLMTKEGFDAIE